VSLIAMSAPLTAYDSETGKPARNSDTPIVTPGEKGDTYRPKTIAMSVVPPNAAS
jgi:hypothetical protein